MATSWTHLTGSDQHIADTNYVRLNCEWKEETVNGNNRLHVRYYVCSRYRLNGTWTCQFSINGTTVYNASTVLTQNTSNVQWSSPVLVGERYVDLSKSQTSATINLVIKNFDYTSVTTGAWTKKDFTQSFTVSLTNTEIIPGDPNILINTPNDGNGRTNYETVQLNGNGISGTFRVYPFHSSSGSGSGNKLRFYTTMPSNGSHIKIKIGKYVNGQGWNDNFYDSGWSSNSSFSFERTFSSEGYGQGVCWRVWAMVKSSTGNEKSTSSIYFTFNDQPYFANNDPRLSCQSLTTLGNSSFNVSWKSANNSLFTTSYTLRYKRSQDSSWSYVTTSGTSYNVNLSNTGTYSRGTTIQFEVCASDPYDADTSYRGSASVKINSLPTVSGSVTASKSFYTSGESITFSLPSKSDVDGQSTTYKVQRSTDGSSWVNHSTGYTSSSISIKCSDYQSSRGGSFYLRVIPNDGFEDGSASGYARVQYNRLPSTPSNILPSSSNFYTDTLSINWNASSDADSHSIRYSVWVSKNGGSYSLLSSSHSTTNYSYNVTNDPYNTTYTFKITAYDGYEDSSTATSITYMKTDSIPPKPTNIKPDSGYYKKSVDITWTNPNTLYNTTGYNVYINDQYIGNTSNTSLTWSIPSADAYRTEYLVSVEAISISGKTNKGFAVSPFFKADMMDKNTNIIVIDDNVIHTVNGKEYYNSIKVNYWYDNQDVSELKYDLQYAIADRDYIGSHLDLTWLSVINDTINDTHSHDITSISANKKIMYRVRSKDSYNDATQWAYSSYCNVYSMTTDDNTPQQYCSIDYPIDNSIVYTKRPCLCICYIPHVQNNYSLSITVNGTEYNNLYQNKHGQIVLECPGDLTNGSNTIKIRDKWILPNGTVATGEYSTVTVNYNASTIDLSEHVKENQFTEMCNRVSEYRKAYGLSELTSGIVKGSTIIRYQFLEKLQNSIDDILSVINRFDNPQTTTLYAWDKYEYINSSMGQLVGKVTSKNKNDYPIDGYANGYWYKFVTSNYKWNKYSITKFHTNFRNVRDYESNVKINGDVDFRGFTTWYFDKDYGFYTKPEDAIEIPRTTKTGTLYYTSGPSWLITVSKTGNQLEAWQSKKICDYDTEYVKDMFIESVSSSDPDMYPDNGIKNNYWYEKTTSEEFIPFNPIRIAWKSSGVDQPITKTIAQQLLDVLRDI